MADTGPTPRRILVVEDSLTQAKRLTHLLERHGFAVACVHDGPAALAAMRDRRPSLVLSDVVMPGMSGYELCAAIRADPSGAELPVALLTALTAPQDILMALEAGATDFITKPYDEAYLINRLHGIFAGREHNEITLSPDDDSLLYAGRRYRVAADRQALFDFLISTYEAAICKNQELLSTQDELRDAKLRLEIALAEKEEALRRRSEAE